MAAASTSFTEVFVRRPVFSTVLTLVVCLLGIVSYQRLSVREMPKIEKPIISVESNYPGANPYVVEQQVTKVLEGVFATIQGAEIITSNSSNEQSKISIQFSPDKNVDVAASEVQERISRIYSELPQDLQHPMLHKSDADAHSIIFIVFTSDTLSNDEIRDYIERFIKSKVEISSGVARADLQGGTKKAMRIQLDTQRLAAYGLTAIEVRNAIQMQCVQRPGGRLTGKDREFMITIAGEINKPEQFDEISIPTPDGKPLKLKDIGRAELSGGEVRSNFWFNGKEGVALGVVKQSTANPLDVCKGIRKIFPDIERALPNGIKATIAMDRTKYIETSIDEVYRTIIEATVLVIIVIFLFLWSFRAAIVPLVTIPVCLLGTFFLLYMFDFTINTITLLAMVLSIGLVVDDAIVVLENVHRHIEAGKSRIEAAIEGTKEIAFAVVAMTLTLAAVYAPIGLAPGKLGKYFREFSLALAGSVMISGFVALTLSPMMCSKVLATNALSSDSKRRWVRGYKNLGMKIHNFIASIERWYAKALKIFLKRRVMSFATGCAVAAIGFAIGGFWLPSEDTPSEDDGWLSVIGHGPMDATYDYMCRNALRVENILKEVPEIEFRDIDIQATQINGGAMLSDWSKRKRTTQDIADSLRSKFANIAGADIYVSASGGGSSASEGDKIEFVLQTSLDLAHLEMYGALFNQLLHQYRHVFPRIETSLLPSAQEYVVNIDRERAASLGISMNEVAETVEILVRGRTANRIKLDGKQYDVIVQLTDKKRSSVQDVSDIFVKVRDSNSQRAHLPNMVTLSDLITITPKQAPIGLFHYDQLLAISFKCDISKGHSLGEAVDRIDDLRKNYLPDDIRLTFSGKTQTYMEESRNIIFIFTIALLFIFLVLSAQFESFIDPFIILLSVPLSIAGALITLKLVNGGSLNIYSKIGMVTLIGLITKHGILIVDFANSLVLEGKSKVDAVYEAAKLRLRPILMTTFAMVLGSLPLAMAMGAGSGARRQIGWVIVGGMSIGTLFTIFILPVVYTMISMKDRSYLALKKR
ncbi:MAG: efflux RND transporter permease subunit [Holosporales bacterium]|jgi:multidrug efflux pump|nr:efflux RND transporter permease subunit [Holosporales bacterium]